MIRFRPQRIASFVVRRPSRPDRTVSLPQTPAFVRAQLAQAWGSLGEAAACVAACGLLLLALFNDATWRLVAAAPVAAGALVWIGTRFGAGIAARDPNLLRQQWVVRVSAATLGLAYAIAAAMLARDADLDHTIGLLLVSMGCLIGGSLLGPMSRLPLVQIVPVGLGCCVGLILQGRALSLVAAMALPAFALWLLSIGLRRNATANERILADLRVAEQTATIEDLLLDFDDGTSDWLWRTDVAGRLMPAAADAGGPASFAGGSLKALLERPASSGVNGARAVLAAIAARKPFRDQLVELASGAEVRWYRLSGKPVLEDGRFDGYRGVGSDITLARDVETRIAHLANHDALTGFVNRASFRTTVDRDGAVALRDNQCRALLCIDLDGFKSVNDGLGHSGGDAVLAQVATRLTAALPGDAVVARLGGDEFAVWLPGTTPLKAEAAARRVSETLAAAYHVDGVQVDIGASVGVAFAPKHGSELDELLRKADLALYRAKEDGKGRVCQFQDSFESGLVERRKLENDLKLAIARSEFLLHYQPLVDTVTGQVVSFEALIRWRSPDRGFVSPGDFIPAAEAAGLISAIGRWALFEACRTAATWPDDIKIAVNVSPPQMRSADFCHEVLMALKTSGLNPSRLVIEVTEGLFLDKSQDALTTLKALRDRGIMIALDDFGTGYSSLRYLVDFPVDKIKIDRSFVADLLKSDANQAIVDAILGLARKLSIRVTAEGIETKEQALALKLKRCDDLQGYLLSKPRPASDVPEMIRTAPAIFREAVPTHMDSPLAMALAVRRQAAG